MPEIKHDFYDCLKQSLHSDIVGQDTTIIKSRIPNVTKVYKTAKELDKQGIDYVAVLKGGATINIDVKRRKKGAIENWENGQPDIQIEIISMIGKDGEAIKIGWSLSQSTAVDYILFLFDDLPGFSVLVPYQLLRTYVIRNRPQLQDKYGTHITHSFYSNRDGSKAEWDSIVLFMPVADLIDGLAKLMTEGSIDQWQK